MPFPLKKTKTYLQCSVLFVSSVLLAKNGLSVVVLLFVLFFHCWWFCFLSRFFFIVGGFAFRPNSTLPKSAKQGHLIYIFSVDRKNDQHISENSLK